MEVEVIESHPEAWNEIQDTVVERKKSGVLLSMFNDGTTTYIFELP
jgi:hypothetical protein